MRSRLVIVVVSFCVFLLVTPHARGEHAPLHITVDPRIELLTVVQYLSGYRLLSQYDSLYKRQLIEHFSPYKDHPVVSKLAELTAEGFICDVPIKFILHYSPPPNLESQRSWPDDVWQVPGGKQRLQQFVSLLRDFAYASRFMSFFEANEGLYQQMIAEVRMKAQTYDHTGTLEAYFGMKQHSYTIILAPMLHDGGIGPRLKQADGRFEAYCVTGPRAVRHGIPTFGPASTLRYLIWHELSHSFVTPLTERAHDALSRYSALQRPILDQMQKRGYIEWSTCVDEHIIRAVTTRLSFRCFGPVAGEQALASERSQAFHYVAALCRQLEAYESQRWRYSSFEEFYPQLVKVFHDLCTAKPKADFFSAAFSGSVDSVVFADSGSVALILPTQEPDKAAQGRIYAYAGKLRDAFFKGATIMEDREALGRDLSSFSLIVLGTVAGNQFLSEHRSLLPFRISEKLVAADDLYVGTRLRLVSAWPNPHDPTKGMLILTAQCPDDIVGIEAVVRLQAGYVVAQGATILTAGNYKKDQERWVFE